ncbi:uncharacterized protein RJT21DRAFT_116959 [Scheffersomyces amazonensis]|uniref:uncharacterized protein n=1 Tax=Scheffersomyces amazonensis TaxID=1078765 RepID=UPI00315C6BCF
MSSNPARIPTSGYYTSQYLHQQQYGSSQRGNALRQANNGDGDEEYYTNNSRREGTPAASTNYYDTPRTPTTPAFKITPSSPSATGISALPITNPHNNQDNMAAKRQPVKVVEFKPMPKSPVPESPSTPRTNKSFKNFFFSKSPTSQQSNQAATEALSLSSDALEEYDEEDDPDYLRQEITPAQLNYFGSQNSDNSDAEAFARAGYQSAPMVVTSPNPNQSVSFNGYYIKQKKDYDQADYKPKLYTHKTFREIFNDKEESTDRYNPMEFVFDQGPKKTNIVKNVQGLFGKDDYNNYNYYDHKSAKPRKNPMKEVFVTESEDEDGNKVEDENADPFDEVEPVKKNKKLTKLFKKKIKKAKKELGKDFVNNTEKQREEKEIRREEQRMKKEQEMKEQEMKEQEAEAEAAAAAVRDRARARAIGQNPDFHPLWNYFLSWVVYDTAASIAGSSKITELPSGDAATIAPTTTGALTTIGAQTTAKAATTIAPSTARPPTIVEAPAPAPAPGAKSRLKNIRKNYQVLASKWNKPAAALFNDQYIPNSTPISTPTVGSGSNSSPSVSSSLVSSQTTNKEFIIEYDGDDDTEIDQELYYNPATNQLEAQPPTSFSSLHPQAQTTMAETTMAQIGTIANMSSPSQIISNINQLIKNIKIMRIIFAPIDIIAENFPHLQTIVILIELGIFMWILYELSLLIDAICMMVKAVCAPMIAMGRFMNRIM